MDHVTVKAKPEPAEAARSQPIHSLNPRHCLWLIKARITISKAEWGHEVLGHCLCLSSASHRSGCAQVQRYCSSSWGGVFVLWATTFKFCREQQRHFTAGPAHPFSSGWDRGHPPPSFSPPPPPPLNCLVLADAFSTHIISKN
jgi:hypothetical protein